MLCVSIVSKRRHQVQTKRMTIECTSLQYFDSTPISTLLKRSVRGRANPKRFQKSTS